MVDEQILYRVACFLFETATAKNVMRSHNQYLPLANDSIAAHSFRTAMIGLVLANMEGVDEAKVLKMCLLHDQAEIRSGDANHVNAHYRRHRKEEEHQAFLDQWKGIP